MPESSIDQMLKQLASDRGRAEAVRGLVGKAEVSQHHVDKAIATCRRPGSRRRKGSTRSPGSST